MLGLDEGDRDYICSRCLTSREGGWRLACDVCVYACMGRCWLRLVLGLLCAMM